MGLGELSYANGLQSCQEIAGVEWVLHPYNPETRLKASEMKQQEPRSPMPFKDVPMNSSAASRRAAVLTSGCWSLAAKNMD